MKIVYPDYDRSILSTLNSCLRYYGAEIAYPTLPELDALINTRPRHVMLLLLDGMGKWPLHRALKEDSYLRDREIATVTSIYPSTTAAATTAYFAAQSALEHGWLGWHVHMKEYAADVILFQSRTYHTEKPVDGPEPGPHSLPFESTFERVRRFRPEICTNSIYPFETYSEHGAQCRRRANSFGEMCRNLQEISASPRPSFTIAYWPEPDSTMHRFGEGSKEADQMFLELDRQLRSLRERLADTLLIVTADHGMINVTEPVDVARIPALLETLVLPPSVEPRAGAFYVKNHRRREFEQAFREECGEDFLLLTREEVLETGLLGRGRQHPRIDDFLGDYFACATGRRFFQFSLPDGRPKYFLKGQHAGLTEDEMLVSVLAERIP